MTAAVLGQAASKLSKASHNLLSFVVKLAVNQLVMTPPFLLFTLAYIQYFLSLDVNKTVDAIRKTFAAALFTNWKVRLEAGNACEVLIGWNCSGLDGGSGHQLSAGSSGIPRVIRQYCCLVVEYLPKYC